MHVVVVVVAPAEQYGSSGSQPFSVSEGARGQWSANDRVQKAASGHSERREAVMCRVLNRTSNLWVCFWFSCFVFSVVEGVSTHPPLHLPIPPGLLSSPLAFPQMDETRQDGSCLRAEAHHGSLHRDHGQPRRGSQVKSERKRDFHWTAKRE